MQVFDLISDVCGCLKLGYRKVGLGLSVNKKPVSEKDKVEEMLYVFPSNMIMV